MATTLKVEKRTQKGKQLLTLRNDGRLPAVVYGPKQKTISLMLDQREFDNILKDGGESTILTLTGLEEDIEVLVHDVAFDSARGGVTHVDFYAIERGKELTTGVSLEFIGEAPVEKVGATVNKVLHEIEVTCRPSVLPSNIEVDLTVLVDEQSQIKISDLKVPTDVKVENDPEDTVANVSAAREEEPEEVVEAPDMDSIEVEKKGKAEDGESDEDGKGSEVTEDKASK